MKSFFIIFFGVSAMRVLDAFHENHNFYHPGKFLYYRVSHVPGLIMREFLLAMGLVSLDLGHPSITILEPKPEE